MRRLLGLTLAALLLARAAPGRAQSAADVDAARELFREGSRLAQEGRWREAEDRYARSFMLKHAAITLYSLGVAQRGNGRLAEALESFRAFLVDPSTATTVPYEQFARDAVADLERRVARVALLVEPPGAPGLAITVDGEPVPAEALGLLRLVNPGPHQIVASASGYAPARAAVLSGEGTVQRVRLELAPAPAAASPAQSPPAAVSAGKAPAVFPAPEGPSRAAPIALLAGGGTAIVAGVSVGLAGVKEASDAPTRNGPEARAARAKTIAGDVVTSGGVAAAAIGLIVLLARRPHAGEPRAAAVAPSIGASAAGLRVRF